MYMIMLMYMIMYMNMYMNMYSIKNNNIINYIYKNIK